MIGSGVSALPVIDPAGRSIGVVDEADVLARLEFHRGAEAPPLLAVVVMGLGCGSGMTCWRRLREWTDAGVWQRLHGLLVAKLNAAGLIDWSRAAVDGSHVRAVPVRGGRVRNGRCPEPAVDDRLPSSCGRDDR